MCRSIGCRACRRSRSVYRPDWSRRVAHALSPGFFPRFGVAAFSHGFELVVDCMAARRETGPREQHHPDSGGASDRGLRHPAARGAGPARRRADLAADTAATSTGAWLAHATRIPRSVAHAEVSGSV